MYPQPGHTHPPAWCLPKSRLRGEDEARGQEMLRRALNLLLRLAIIDKGKLLQCPYEMVLPTEVRTTWPGQEKEDSLVHMQMDASGEGLYLIDLNTGRYIQETFTVEEQELFNAFELGEQATNINHRELLSELFGVVLLGPEHAGKLINLINDNTAAEHWTSKDHHQDARVDQILSILGLSETMLKQTLIGSRVKTTENFADFGTRQDKAEDYKKGIAALEKKYGWIATRVEVPEWLRRMGWTQLRSQISEGDWYTQAVEYVRWLRSSHPGLIENQCKVDSGSIQEALELAASGTKIMEVPTSDGDFAPSTLSKERVWATHVVPLTPNQLQRNLHELQGRLGEVEGAREFCLLHGFPDHMDPQRAIWDHLEGAYEEVFQAFAVENRKFRPEAKRPESLAPGKLPLPPGCRLLGRKKMSSAFTGTGSVDTSMEDTGFIEVTSFCEQAPHLVEHLKARHPQARPIKRLSDYMDPDHKRSAHHHDASPPCPAHATANLYRRGNADEFCGRHFEEQGKYIEHLEPLSAHIECNVGVLDRQPGRKSPMEILEDNLPSYFVAYYKVDAGKTTSPATGRQAAMCHERVHVFCWRRSCFETKPKIGHLVNKTKAVTSYEHCLDNPEEGQWYYTMPVEDQKAVTYFTDVKPTKHAIRIGEIFQPEPGRGHHLFPNGIEDPRAGPGSVDTAVSGSKWIPRIVNGKLTLTRLRNEEIARKYCADGRRNIDPAWLADGSFKGQHALGNMVPSNVADWVAHLLVTESARIQKKCGLTGYERWEAETELQPETVSGGFKRGPVVITPEEDSEILELIEEISRSGKKTKTYQQYDSHFEHWSATAQAKGWSNSLEGLEPREICKRVIYWLALERKRYNLKARTLRTKLSAIRWKHIADWGPDPFEKTPGISDWLSNLEKLDGPTEVKLPVPITLLQMILCFLNESFEHKSLKAALLTAFWYLLRSIEYLAEDDGIFDPNRSLTWGDVMPRIRGRTLPLADISQADEISLTLYSSKNSLETCIRTLQAVPGSDTCVVQALQELHQAFLKEFGRAPKLDEAVFKKSESQVYRRKDISQVLKIAAATAGIPDGRIASHSLRRGGCSQYIAAGGQKEEPAIQRFGRWKSTAYKGYVMGASNALAEIQVAVAQLVPRFERN